MNIKTDADIDAIHTCIYIYICISIHIYVYAIHIYIYIRIYYIYAYKDIRIRFCTTYCITCHDHTCIHLCMSFFLYSCAFSASLWSMKCK